MLTERANKGLHDFVFNKISTEIGINNIANLLDIGCGTGAWLSRFEKAGVNHLMGIDLDTAQFALPKVPAEAVNLDHYSGQVFGSFTLITALELIEHLANPGLLLQLVQKNLLPGGYFVLSTPNIHALPARLRYLIKGRLNHFDDKSDATHIYPVYMENLERLLPRYGLSIVKILSFPENGYITYSKSNLLLSKIAGLLLAKDNYPGDNLVIVLRNTLG